NDVILFIQLLKRTLPHQWSAIVHVHLVPRSVSDDFIARNFDDLRQKPDCVFTQKTNWRNYPRPWLGRTKSEERNAYNGRAYYIGSYSCTDFVTCAFG